MSCRDELAYKELYSNCPLLSKMNQQYRIVVEDYHAFESESMKDKILVSEMKATEEYKRLKSEVQADSTSESEHNLRNSFDTKASSGGTLNRSSISVSSLTQIGTNISCLRNFYCMIHVGIF